MGTTHTDICRQNLHEHADTNISLMHIFRHTYPMGIHTHMFGHTLHRCIIKT